MSAPVEEAPDVEEEAPALEEDLATPVEVAPVVEKDAAPVLEPANSQSEEAEEVVSRRWWTEKVAPVVEGMQLQFRSKQSLSENAEEVDTEG